MTNCCYGMLLSSWVFRHLCLLKSYIWTVNNNILQTRLSRASEFTLEECQRSMWGHWCNTQCCQNLWQSCMKHLMHKLLGSHTHTNIHRNTHTQTCWQPKLTSRCMSMFISHHLEKLTKLPSCDDVNHSTSNSSFTWLNMHSTFSLT